MKRDDSESRRWLDLAARAAARGFGDVEPNPMVGAVIVRDGRLLGVGHHRRFGGAHAEVDALESCRRQGDDPRGATMYVTLEPCNHVGKQPPCTEAVLAAGIARVVIARRDPNPVSAGGLEALLAAGVEVEVCGQSQAALEVGDAFAKRVTTGLPWVIAKWAQTPQGLLVPPRGRWISSPASRRRVHALRAKVDAIVTGLGTVEGDDPMLSARGVRKVRRVATRVVVDTRLRISAEAAIVRTAREIPTLIACGEQFAASRPELAAAGVQVLGLPHDAAGLDLAALLRALAARGVSTVMLEAGARLLGSFLREELADEAVVYVPAGGDRAAAAKGVLAAGPLASARGGWHARRVKRSGEDAEVVFRRTHLA